MCHVARVSCCTYVFVLSQVRGCRVTLNDEKLRAFAILVRYCHTYVCVMTHMQVHHRAHMCVSCRACACFVSHSEQKKLRGHATLLGYCHVYVCVLSHVCVCVSYRTYVRVLSYVCVHRVTHMCVCRISKHILKLSHAFKWATFAKTPG